jgi:uncharacterized protein
MKDQTNPRPEARTRGAERAAISDRTNPRPAPRSGLGERSATDDQTNPKRTRGTREVKRSAIGDQRKPEPGTDVAEQTNPKPAATAAASPGRLHYDDAYIRGILQRVRTIAAVGMSANDMRPSYFAMLYLQQKGYRMIPVNPRYAGQQILGETVVASLDDLPAPPDMVQVFRKADEAPAVVDEAIRAGARVVWLQLGIRSEEAAAKARAAGLDVVMDRCPKIEYGRLFGEIGWAGVNRRVISAKKGQALQLSRKKGGLARRLGPRS